MSVDQAGDLDVAITGIALRFPGADSPEQFWDNLTNGVSSIRRFDADELRAAGVHDALISNPRYVPVSGYLSGAADFDPDRFGMPRAEARIIDPQHRLFLECAWDALEDAGYDPRRLDGRRVGCYGGSGMAIYAGAQVRSYLSEYLAGDPAGLENLAPLQAFISTQSDHLCMRVSHRLGLRGPSIAVQTACSTGLVAVHLAAQSLLTGESDMALAGASGVHFPLAQGYLYQEGSILSPDGVCRPFDAGASGTVGGSGAAVVVLRRLADALADGDPIWAVVKGSAVNNDGPARAGYLAPSPEGQLEVVHTAHRMAGVSAGDIGFVEAHGTGTSLGDRIELTALNEAFQAAAARSVALGSVKSSIGHLDTAAGMAGLIKTVLAVRHGQIPPTLNFRQPNTVLDRADSPFVVSSEPQDWSAGHTRRLAGVSSFGGGGTNAHIVLAEPPSREAAGGDGPFVLPLSGRDAPGLREQAAAYTALLQERDPGELAVICGTADRARPTFAHRAALVAVDRDRMLQRLSALTAGRPDPGLITGLLSSPDRGQKTFLDDAPLRPVFLFSGQGSSVSVAAKALRVLPAFREALAECRDVLPEAGRWFGLLETDDEELRHRARWAQPALFAFQYALSRTWHEAGVRPGAVLGHSLGEYAAACAAGVMSLPTAMSLVSARGALMDEYGRQSGMLAVGAGREQVQQLLRRHALAAEVAVVNGDEAVVVGGAAEVLETLVQVLGPRVNTFRLETTHGFHTSAMDPVLPAFAQHVRAAELGRPRLPFEPTSDNNPAPFEEAEYWIDQVRRPVSFAAAFRRLAGQHTLFLEIGPAAVLARLGHTLDPGARIVASLTGPVPQLEQLYRAAGEMHVRGAGVDLSRLGHRLSQPVRRTRVPLSQHKREELWAGGRVRPVATLPTSRISRTGPHPDVVPDVVPDHLLGQVCWDRDTTGETAMAQDQPARHWTVVAATDHPRREALLSALHDQGIAHSTCEPYEIAALGRSLADGVVYLPRTGNQDSGRSVVEAAQILRAVLERGEQTPGPVIVLSCETTAGTVAADADVEAVHAFTRCVRLEYPRRVINTVMVAPDDLKASLPRILQGQGQPETLWREGQRHVRHIHALDAADTVPVELRPDATYVVSGGTGALGRQIVRWLIERGARHVLTINRNDPPVAAHGLLGQWGAQGIDVLPARADVADPAQSGALGTFLKQSMPPVRGVLHLAGVVHDAPLATVDPADVERVHDPKVAGVRALLSLTQDAELDFFVGFSSITAVLGAPGQGAYAAANAAMDAVIGQVRAQGGVKASSVCWGPWAGEGMFAGVRQQFGRHSRILGELDPDWAMSVLDRVVASPGLRLVAARTRPTAEDMAIAAGAFSSPDRLARQIWDTPPGEAAMAVRPGEVVAEAGPSAPSIESAPAWQRPGLLRDYLCSIVADLFEHAQSDIDVQAPLGDLGVDSLGWLRIRNRIGADLALELSSTVIYNHPSIDAMSGHLSEYYQ